ncbi:MAG: glutaredoxin family protein [Ktedonobacteraceae bacterium]
MSRQKKPASPQVTFYTKAGCHLCEEARDMLDDIAAEVAYELTEIDIRSNPEIFEQYRYRIPVIIVDTSTDSTNNASSTLLEGRIEFRDVAKAFQLP